MAAARSPPPPPRRRRRRSRPHVLEAQGDAGDVVLRRLRQRRRRSPPRRLASDPLFTNPAPQKRLKAAALAAPRRRWRCRRCVGCTPAAASTADAPCAGGSPRSAHKGGHKGSLTWRHCIPRRARGRRCSRRGRRAAARRCLGLHPTPPQCARARSARGCLPAAAAAQRTHSHAGGALC